MTQMWKYLCVNIVDKIWNFDGDILILIYVIFYDRNFDKDYVVSNIKVTCVFVILLKYWGFRLRVISAHRVKVNLECQFHFEK